jgi:uncharacterized protein with HEPN domain
MLPDKVRLRGVSEETQSTLPDIPWDRLRGMRNRLIHVYFDVNHDILWQTATQDVPSLAVALRRNPA